MDEFREDITTLKEKLAKNSRILSKHKSAKEESDLKVMRLEAELQSFKTLLNDKTREYKEVMSINEVLEEKNARLRKETIKLARERNEADSYAKDKNFSANVKSQKIKVLKSQLKTKGSKGKQQKLAESQAKLNPNKNYLASETTSRGMGKNKSHQTLPKYKVDKSRLSMFQNQESDSGVSDVDEDEYLDSQFEAGSQFGRYANIGPPSSRNGEMVLPKIMGRQPAIPMSPSLASSASERVQMVKKKTKVYQSWANDEDLEMISQN